MSEILLAVQGVSKSFGGVQALKNVNFTVRAGEIHCLVGENGSGKSTLIKAIAGVISPDSGQIVIDGKSYQRLRPIDAVREGIQVIYQDLSLFPNLSVAENIAISSILAQNRRVVDWQEVRRTAKTALERVGHSIPLDVLVETLPVAEKQLVAICRALVQNARLIIMDEATTALTEREVQNLFEVIRNLQSQGISILFVSHKLNEVLAISERITIIRNGSVVAEGNASEFDRAKMVQLMTGRNVEQEPFTYERPTDIQPLLRVENLYRRKTFADISFELYPGEILGITGLLGSGRTELALALFGLRPADGGYFYLDGKPVQVKSVTDAIRHGIGYVPEDRLTEGLFLPQAISKNMIISNVRHLTTRMGFLNRQQMKEQVAQWIQKLSIKAASPDIPVQTLSGGNQQRVVLAKWLATKPRVLILNGPTVGVDVGSRAEIYKILRDLARDGLGIIIISDDLPELLQNCNRILVMRRGRIVEELRAADVTEDQLALKLSGGMA